MKRVAMSLVLFVVAALSCQFAVAQLVVISNPTIQQEEIHQSADATSPVVGTLNDEDGLIFIQNDPGGRWREVDLGNQQTGFIRRSVTRLAPDQLGSRNQDELRAHFINIGTGSCAMVECPGPNAPIFMVDCGSMGRPPGVSNSTQLNNRTRDYVNDLLGITSNNTQPTRTFNLIVSHADRDHFRLIPTVLGPITPNEIILGGIRDEYDPNDTDGFETWLNNRAGAVRAGFAANHTTVGDAGLQCGTAAANILTVNTGASKNAQSLVVEFRHHDFALTLTGDAIGATEAQAIVNGNENVGTTVLAGSHHGADTHNSNSDEWINAAAPKAVIFSAGSRFGHPRCDIVRPFKEVVATVPAHDSHCGIGNVHQPTLPTNKAVYTTFHSGHIIVTSNGSSPMDLFCTESDRCATAIAH